MFLATLLLSTLAIAAPAAGMPKPNPAQCLSGRFLEKFNSWDAISTSVQLSFEMRNACPQPVLGYAGMMVVKGNVGGFQTIRYGYTHRSRIDAASTRTSMWDFRMFGSYEDIWLHSVRANTVTADWITTFVVLLDGSTLAYDPGLVPYRSEAKPGDGAEKGQRG